MGVVLAVAPLTAEAFRPFGEVIATDGAERRTINDGMATRFHDLADIDVGIEGGVPLLSIFRGLAHARPIRIAMLERHPLGSQAFVPINGSDWLVVAAEGDATPDLATIRCFRARADQGVNYRRGTWHHPLLVLAPAQDFLVIDRGGPGDNLETFRLPAADVRILED